LVEKDATGGDAHSVTAAMPRNPYDRWVTGIITAFALVSTAAFGATWPGIWSVSVASNPSAYPAGVTCAVSAVLLAAAKVAVLAIRARRQDARQQTNQILNALRAFKSGVSFAV